MDNVTKEIVELNENYLYNDMLTRALVQLLPQNERAHINIWLNKLQEMNGDNKTLTKRNEYTRLLLLAVQSGKLTEPFDQLPSSNELPPISDTMPPHLFQEMLTSSQENLTWLNIMKSEDDLKSYNNTNSNYVQPHKFLDCQPQPINGITCYFSVFSKE